ncbi:MAG TPA: hypothetical protein VEP90_02430, partial [Methylomirabilota bacterium]|nr:hypothetical protein [Methylomirabilota bacterium]
LTLDKEAIPDEYIAGLTYLISTVKNHIPWTGYYAQYKNIPLAIANMYGIWFKIQMKKGQWQAHRPAQKSLGLINWPYNNINLDNLY